MDVKLILKFSWVKMKNLVYQKYLQTFHTVFWLVSSEFIFWCFSSVMNGGLWTWEIAGAL